MSKEKRRVIRYYLQIGTIMWGDNMSRITSYGKQSITDLLGKMNQAENAIDQADKTEDGKSAPRSSLQAKKRTRKKPFTRSVIWPTMFWC